MVPRGEVVQASGGLGLGVESRMAGSCEVKVDQVGSSWDPGLKSAREMVFEKLV